MPAILIAVHGMGSNPPGWSDGVRSMLEAKAKEHGAVAEGATLFGSALKFVEIGYDSVFNGYLSRWKDARAEFDDFIAKQSATAGSSWSPDPLFNWLNDRTLPADVTTAFWSTAMDPVLYRGAPLVRDDVRSAVAQQIFAAITSASAAAGGAAVDVYILAHSLGTIAVHDVLQLAATNGLGGNASYAARQFQFKVLFMLADVARLGPPDLIDQRVDKSGYCVRPLDPRANATPLGSYYTGKMLSFRHAWDPFVRWAPLIPARWNADWGENFVDATPLTHVHQANVHGFTHYLDHPAVHIPIINSLLGYSAISSKEQLDAVARYPQFGSPQCSAVVARLRGLVESFPSDTSDLPSIAAYGAQFFAAVQGAANACKDLPSGL